MPGIFEQLNSNVISTFGELAMGFSIPTYTRGSTSVAINGIFDPHGILPDQSIGTVMLLFIRISDLTVSAVASEPQNGDYVLIRGTKYFVNSVLSDEGGGANLVLRKG